MFLGMRHSICQHAAVVNVSDYDFAGLGLIPGVGSRRAAHLAIHPSFRDGRKMGT